MTIDAPYGALEPNETMPVSATVHDLAGRVKTSAVVTWSLTDSAAMAITSQGVVTAKDVSAERTVTIIASVDGVADSAEVAVVPVSVPTRRQPILFVHGLSGSAQDWVPIIARFRRDGWLPRELFAATYSSTQSNVAVAEAIKGHVTSLRTATGWDRVHIVSYSMGSLSSRHYLKSLGGDQHVESWSSISGPNHGTNTAALCSSTPCIEMRPGSSFLTTLNAGDETPGSVRYATWWSPCDNLVVPAQSTILAGAQNTETACLAHDAMFTETNYQQVRAFIRP